MRRTGSEPVQARSPLRLRLGLALFGAVWGTVAAVGFGVSGEEGWAAFLGAIALIALVDLALVIRRMRQGSSYQPGREVPMYRLPEPPRSEKERAQPRKPWPEWRRWYEEEQRRSHR